jgi:hypothetical protein
VVIGEDGLGQGNGWHRVSPWYGSKVVIIFWFHLQLHWKWYLAEFVLKFKYVSSVESLIAAKTWISSYIY